MTAAEPTAQSSWRGAAALSMVLVGLLLVALSIIWPRVFTGTSRWPDDKALAYQAASSRLHELSMKDSNTPADKKTRDAQVELAKAKAEYALLLAELKGVQDLPARIATLLRYGGLILLVAGTVALIRWR